MQAVTEGQGAAVVITSGSDFDPSRKLPYHARGMAWDFRSHYFTDPSKTRGRIEELLRAVDNRFRVLYHDSGHGKHFHVEYQFNRP
jgi:hypothetical protein